MDAESLLLKVEELSLSGLKELIILSLLRSLNSRTHGWAVLVLGSEQYCLATTLSLMLRDPTLMEKSEITDTILL